MPLYSPELNLQEHVWDELREKFFHNRAFDSLDALETHLEEALRSLESSPERMRSIAGRDWIINSIFNDNWNKTSSARLDGAECYVIDTLQGRADSAPTWGRVISA